MRRSPKNQADIAASIDEVLAQLREHWVFDVVELLSDCAVATHRISELLSEIKRKPNQVVDRRAFNSALKQFSEYEQYWGKLAKQARGERFARPDVLEWHLSQLRDAALSSRRRATLKKRDSQEDFDRSYETVQRIRASQLSPE